MVITQTCQQPTLPLTSNDRASQQQSCADLVKEYQLDDGCEDAAVAQPCIIGRGKTVRIALLSDVHLEFGDRPLPAPDAGAYDILVAAGDIGPVPQAIERLKSLGKPVVYVLGNHERYHRDCHEVVLEAKALAKDSQVYVLERDAVVIGGVRFLGTTLWTDRAGPVPDLSAILATSRFSSDHNYKDSTCNRYAGGLHREALLKLYKNFPSALERELAYMPHDQHEATRRLYEGCPDEPIQPSAPGLFDAAIASIEHAVSLRWLHRQLTTDFAGPTVVVSHHAPSLQSVGETPAFLKNREHWNRLGMHKELFEVLNYASDLSATLKEHSHAIQLWCHGHVHESRDYLEGGVRVVCNAQGLGANTPGVITLELKATGVPVATAPFQPTHAARREDSHAL